MTGEENKKQGKDVLLIRYQISYDRIRELASYIRITDAAIWGFLGLAFIELFKEKTDEIFISLAIFSILVIISMYLWRRAVKNYQKDIVEEYTAIRCYEICLNIDSDHSLTSRQNRKTENWINGEYDDKTHRELNKIACVISGFATLYLIAWLMVINDFIQCAFYCIYSRVF